MKQSFANYSSEGNVKLFFLSLLEGVGKGSWPHGIGCFPISKSPHLLILIDFTANETAGRVLTCPIPRVGETFLN